MSRDVDADDDAAKNPLEGPMDGLGVVPTSCAIEEENACTSARDCNDCRDASLRQVEVLWHKGSP